MLLLWSCHGTPSYVIPPGKMAQLLADIHIGEAVVNSDIQAYATDSQRRALKQSIFIKHGVTNDQVDTSMMWYGRHIDKYHEVYDQTIKILEKRIEQTEKTGALPKLAQQQTVSQDADSANMFDHIITRRISPLTASENYDFHFRTDRNWERGDIYRLSTALQGAHGMLTLNLAVMYGDGTTEYLTQEYAGDGMHNLVLVLDSARSAQSVYGSINYVPARGEVAFMDSVALVRTRNRDDNARRRLAHPALPLNQ